jgi:hypothetical protein
MHILAVGCDYGRARMEFRGFGSESALSLRGLT